MRERPRGKARLRRRQLEIEEHLAPCRAVEAKEVDEVVINRVEAERGVGEDREERDDPGAGEHGRLLGKVDQQKRRDRHDRRDLQDHRIGIERIFDETRLVEQHGEADPTDGREQKTLERRRERDEKRGRQQRAIGHERREHEPRGRQHVGRNPADADHELP